MSDTTRIDSSHGPVHTGPGSQNNVTHNHNYPPIRDSVTAESAGRDPRRVAVDELRRLKQRFVHPLGSERARQVLNQWSTVLVTAAPGDGARSAAEILLCELPHATERFRELVDQAEERDTGRALDPEQVEDGAALLLDLTARAEERYRVFMDELPSFLATVRERRAQLAVVLAPEQQGLLNARLRDLVAPLKRPDEHAVLRRHLLFHGMRPNSKEVADPRLSGFLATASMDGIAELAEGVLHARESAHGAGDFPVWLAAALTSLEPGANDVAAKITGLEDAQPRALLLTTALLHGARADTIHGATAQLLTALKHPDLGLPLLQQPTLSAQLEDVGATTQAGGRVQFATRKYDEAVRTYFWDNFPQVRPALRSWVRDAAAFPSLGRSELLTLVTRYARQCLRTGPASDLSGLAERWTHPSSPPSELSMAARALGEGVRNPQHGSYFRRQIYDWSREPSLPRSRADVLIGVCSEAVAVHFPDQAMTRLLHLSRHHDAAVRHTAGEALLRITHSDNRLYLRLLSRFPGPDRFARPRAELFLRLADPARLTGDGQYGGGSLITSAVVREHLAAGWALVLKHLDLRDYGDQVVQWLNTALTQPRYADPLLDVLVGGAGQDAGALSRLHFVATRCWAASPQDPARAEILSALRRRIDLAQGIAPASSPPPRV